MAGTRNPQPRPMATCEICATTFVVRALNNKGRFCSRACVQIAIEQRMWHPGGVRALTKTAACPQCAKPFETFAAKPRKHCSPTCAQVARLHGQPQPCSVCGTLFRRKPSRMSPFCSMRCSASRRPIVARPKPPPKISAEAQPPRSRLAKMIVLSSNRCCWPFGDPKWPSFRFCEALAVSGRPYCGEHCAIAYVRSDRGRDAAA